MKEVKIKELEEYYKKLTKKEKEKLFPWVIIGPEEEMLSNLNKFQLSSIKLLTDNEIDELKNIIKEKKVKEVNKSLLDKLLIFKEKNNYVITNNVVEGFKVFINSNEIKMRKKGIIYYYVIANGIIEMSKLIELCNKTGVAVTKKDIEEVAKDAKVIMKKGTLYLNPLAEHLSHSEEIQEVKRENDYKVFDIEEVIMDTSFIMRMDYPKKIYNMINQKTKKDNLMELSCYMYYLACSGFEYKESVENALKNSNIKLSNKKMASLEELLKQIEESMPLWSLNGYMIYEIEDEEDEEDYDEDDYDEEYDNEEYEKKLLDNMTKEEKLEMYLYTYIKINGIIHISKLIEILDNNHSIKINDKELKKYIKTLDDIYIIEDYLCGAEIDKEEFSFIQSIKTRKEYKIVDNIFNFNFDDECYEDDFTDLCREYELDEDQTNKMRYLINVGMFNEEILPAILEDFNIHMSLKKQRGFMDELKKVIKNLRLWNLNGFRQNEINSNIVYKTKIGRNEKCQCGSGLKYKYCCGK